MPWSHPALSTPAADRSAPALGALLSLSFVLCLLGLVLFFGPRAGPSAVKPALNDGVHGGVVRMPANLDERPSPSPLAPQDVLDRAAAERERRDGPGQGGKGGAGNEGSDEVPSSGGSSGAAPSGGGGSAGGDGQEPVLEVEVTAGGAGLSVEAGEDGVSATATLGDQEVTASTGDLLP